MRKRREPIILNDKDRQQLIKISKTRLSHSHAWVQRSKILLALESPGTFKQIAKDLEVSDIAVRRCYQRYHEYGKDAIRALDDRYRSGRPPNFDFERQNQVVSLACEKPVNIDNGSKASEVWTQTKLAKYLRETYSQDPAFKNIHQTSISRLFKRRKIKPFKITYYIQKRDPDFDKKLKDVMNFYKQASLDRDLDKVYISIDEKTAIQALKQIHPDIHTINGILRDPNYKRLGTVDTFAGLFLQKGIVYALVRDHHTSSDFTDFLRLLDSVIDVNKQIKLLADNATIHTSKDTRKYVDRLKIGKRVKFSPTIDPVKKIRISAKRIKFSPFPSPTSVKKFTVSSTFLTATVPIPRFTFTFTPKHGSWLNAIEGVFSKMQRTSLKGIRVNSRQELKDRILAGVSEMNLEAKPANWSKYLEKYFNEESV